MVSTGPLAFRDDYTQLMVPFSKHVGLCRNCYRLCNL